MIRLLLHFFRRFTAANGTQLAEGGILVMALLVFSSSGFMFLGLADRADLHWGDAIWWSVVTMTTVGYGDYFPVTPGGRYLIGFPTMIFGISILGYLLSTVASFLIEARSKELKGMGEILLEDHILIIHFQNTARIKGLVDELRADDKTREAPIVLIDDHLEELPDELANAGVRFIRGDASKESTLERANFRAARFAMILSKDDNDPMTDNHNLAAVLTLEQLYPEIFTVAECVDQERVDLMYKAGADAVVCMATMSANLLVQEMLDPGVQALIDQATSNISGQQFYMVPIEKVGDGRYATVRAAMEQQGYVVLGFERASRVYLNPAADETINESDRVACIGPKRPEALRC